MALTLDEAREHIAQKSFRFDPETEGGRVGLEPEFFPITTDAEGNPTGRLRLDGPRGDLEIVDEVARTGSQVLPREAGAKRFDLANGGNVTFEPGAQMEHSTRAHETAGSALADVEALLSELVPAVEARGAKLAALGTDVWSDLESVPMQLDHWRYRSMQAFFDQRGAHGRVMMRHTATTQINLDLGAPGTGEERYLAANLISPFVTATFTCSPTEGASRAMGEKGVCARALAWQGLDPSRTGFPLALVEGRDDFSGAWAEAVLSADLMLVRDGDGALPGERGFSFEDWLREGHPRRGPATLDDLDYHMTTVFFEVRPRGFLELRAADGLPTRWRAAVVVYLAGLIYDREARGRALELCEPDRAKLPDLWHRAARRGLRDDELFEKARALFRFALEGASRLPEGFFRPEDLRTAERFFDHFTDRRRMPMDEVCEAFRESPAKALAWAAE